LFGLTTDQRGFGPRVAGGGIDIGAFEFGAQPPPPPVPPSPPPPPPPPPPPATVVFRQVRARVVKVKGKSAIEVRDAATGALRQRLFPFGAFKGRVLVVLADLDGDGVADILALASVGGGLRKKAFNGRTLGPLAVP
jgi:hypothetical protein